MKIFIETADQNYKIDAAQPLSIAIALRFNGAQPNAYGVEKASAKPCEAGALVGDTRRGGSVNFEQYKFIPHCNGTHTECVGHITHARISVHDCLRDAFSLAYLISVEPEISGEIRETYPIKLNESDKLITRKALEQAIKGQERFVIGECDALVVRTLPNSDGKLTQIYRNEIPPFFSTEAVEFINHELCMIHLLCDLPSIDRIFDEGKLSNHRIFWNIEPGSFEVSERTLTNNTITELIYVPDAIEDGAYLLNLQIAPFAADAAPSRPVLFKIYE